MRISIKLTPARSHAVGTLVFIAVALLTATVAAQSQPATPPPVSTPQPRASLPAPSLAPQPKNAELEARSQRLSLWLAELSDSGKSSRVLGATSYFTGASAFGLLGGLGIASLGADDKGSNGAGIFVTSLVLGVSGGYLYAGIAAIAFVTTDEERYRRWQALRARDELSVARFEGELEAEAKLARWRRYVSAGSSVGLAAVGGAALVLTPTQRLNEDARAALYVYGGAMLALGAWSIVSELAFESSNEHAYRMYRAGKSPETSESKPQVTPHISPHGAGLAVAGRF